MLAFACAFTMFAGAASYSDQADIQHSEAVDMLSALGVLQGYEDGSFGPDKTITRAEMAKMIYTIRNAGNDNADAYKGLSTSFTDVYDGYWAEGYIKYCQVNGIIDGKSATSFDPEGQVTVVETAKMALVLMGYKADANRANLVGAGWDSRTLALATDNSLLDQVAGGVSEAITRDEAAQLLYNTVNAKCVLWSNDKETFIDDTFTVGNGQNQEVKTYTVGTKYLGLQEWIGTFVGNDKTGATNKDGYIVVNGSLDGTGDKTKDVAFANDLDIKYIGEEVSVLFKDAKGGTNNELDDKDYVYGVYVTGDTDVYNITMDDLQDADANKIKFGDKNYDVADNFGSNVYENYKDTAVQNVTVADFDEGNDSAKYVKQSGDTIKFVTDDNGDICAAYIVESEITKVNAVNNTSVSMQTAGQVKFDENDNAIYDGIAKDDVVVYTKLYNDTNDKATFTVTKAETVSGELESYKKDGSDLEEVTVDGTVYKVDDKTIKDLTDDGVKADEISEGNIGDAVTLYLVNGYVGAIDMTASASNYAVVENIGNGSIGGVDEFKMKVMLADGTEKTVTIDEDSKYTNTNAKAAAEDFKNSKDGKFVPYIVKYASINDSNVMDVTAIYKDVTEGGAAYDKDTKQLGDAMTTSDAVLFVKTNNDFYAYTIRDLGNIGAAEQQNTVVVTNKDGKVVAAYMTMGSKPSGATTDTVYGIVTGGGNTVKIDDEYYNRYTVANDQESFTVNLKNDTLAKGDIVAFEKASDDCYTAGDVIALKNGVASVDGTAYVAYIDEMDGDDVLSYYAQIGDKPATQASTYALDDDCQIVYVDQDNDAAGSNIGVNEYDSITGYANAIVVVKEKKIVAIIVESSGEKPIVG